MKTSDDKSRSQRFKHITQSPTITNPVDLFAKNQYKTPIFVFFEMLAGFTRHNIFGLAASLSFYTLFALIPLILLIFFLLSQLVFTSDYAIVKLAILLGNLIPDMSNAVMLEVYGASQKKAAWGIAGLIVLLWAITPLASSIRSAFYTISSLIEPPSFIRRKLKDILAVLGMLLLFMGFTFAGIMLENVIRFLASHWHTQLDWIGALGVWLLTCALVAAFYRIFFPIRITVKHLLIGAIFTATLWMLMRPAFGLFLSVNPSYGAVFGSMKGVFVSITWLYLNFAVFLLGTELIATLRKKDVLLIKGLFEDNAHTKAYYISTLVARYGIELQQDDIVFEEGNTEHKLYYIVEGSIELSRQQQVMRTLSQGDYFGELALLSDSPNSARATVISESAKLIQIQPEQLETLLNDEPRVAMKFLRQIAARLQQQAASRQNVVN